MGKVKQHLAGVYNKKEYVVQIRTLKQALNHGLVLKKVHKATKCNQKAWLKPYIHINAEPRKNATTTEARGNYFVSEINSYDKII